jgi:excisionase family DNA binding protein
MKDAASVNAASVKVGATDRLRPSARARQVPRLALSKAEAAASLGISVDHFERHVQPELRIVYRGRRRLIPVRELEKWLEQEASRCGL